MTTIDASHITAAMKRVAEALESRHSHLTELDQALGDGDLGITMSKVAAALADYAATPPEGDLGKYLTNAGMAVNRAASSTMGTLLATALMRAGKEVKGAESLTPEQLATMLKAAENGMMERGKAKLGDKTILDALHPAAESFAAAVAESKTLEEAGATMLAAAEKGLEDATPLRSRIGRAGWVGSTEGKVDPGCAALVIILSALIGKETA